MQPGIGLVIAVQAGNYDAPDAWMLPVKLIEEFVAPEVRRRMERD